MKELFVQFAKYNLWANGLLLTAIEGLTEKQQQAEVRSSFGSLQQTVLHIWNTESIWWQRINLQQSITGPAENFRGIMKDVSIGLLEQNKQWQEWISSIPEPMLQHELIYYNSKKEKFKQPVFQILLHLFNHGTYHRGQVVTILRQLEADKIPSTDFIVWSRREI